MRTAWTVWSLAAACMLPLGTASAQMAADDLPITRQVQPMSLTNSVSLPSGTVVHRTSNTVANVRSYSVPGTPTVILNWEEILQDGSRQGYTVWSKDGLTLSSRPYELSNVVRLRYQNFDPALGVPAVPGMWAADAGNQIHLVQFVGTPLEEFRDVIAAMGGEVHRFLPDNTFIVQLPAGAANQMRQQPYVRFVGEFHPGYRLSPEIRDALRAGVDDPTPTRFSIETFRAGEADQQKVMDRVVALGGTFRVVDLDGSRIEAHLPIGRIIDIARMNEVHYIDTDGGPAEHDMDIVRNIGGANFIETTLGFTGQGVRAEVFDSELRTTHQEFSLFVPILHSTAFTPGTAHGTSVFSIMFARGADAAARGLLPNAEARVFYRGGESTQFGGTHLSRLQIAADLANAASNFRSVLQTSSLGSARNLVYSTITAEMDTLLFTHNVLHLQSQSNAGTVTSYPTNARMSRPQAWAKNILSGGAVNHLNTLSRTDDRWLDPPNGIDAGTSIGPAEDGRIKPDLCFFYDDTRAASNGSNSSYTAFGGTSGATPSIAGYAGLFHQMWHEGVWPGYGGRSNVWESRPSYHVVKAALINTAFRYTWNVADPLDIRIIRVVQGWGMPDMQNLYNKRERTIIDAEQTILSNGQSKRYLINVLAGEPTLNVTMSYRDPSGTTSASQHRINDLSVRLTAPNGVIRWGNNGLGGAGTGGSNFNTTGGVSNKIDTVENIFVENPAAGTWIVDVFGDQIVQNARPGSTGISANYALWITGAQLDGGQGCLGTTTANNGRTEAGAGVFLNLTPSDNDLLITEITSETGTAATGNVNIEIYTRPGTYVGFTGSNVGWTLARSVVGTGNGATFTVDLTNNPIRLPKGATTGMYIVNQSAGGVRYTGTGGAVQETWVNDDLTLFAAHARGGPPFSGTEFTPRVFAGNICYDVDFGTNKTNCQPLDIPSFDRTFTGQLTRGFYFQVPAGEHVTICSLNVPNEASQNVQNVEVVRFNAAPPVFPTTTNAFNSLFRSVNQSVAAPLATQIRLNPGDHIGVLGATGVATNMFNSYSALLPTGTYASAILDRPTNLTRINFQNNLFSNPAADLSMSNGNIELGRVEVGYRASPWGSEAPEQPAFDRTFSSTSLTRGFWFTAPRDFDITGLRVPNEVAGPQNVQVVRFDAAPPNFPTSTGAFSTLFRATGVNNTFIIQCNIRVKQGDIIGILGATGTATMNNSYSAALPNSAFATDVLGTPMTIRRLLFQGNLNTTAPTALSQESSATTPFEIGRVFMWVKCYNQSESVLLDGDTQATGSNLLGGPLNTPFGQVRFPIGEFVAFAEPEMNAAGSFGNQFDIVNTTNGARLEWDFNVHSVTFVYGGNLGGIRVEALNQAGAVVDVFEQADTFNGQPAGPQILRGNNIRAIRWNDTTPGSAFAGLDNIVLKVGPQGPTCPSCSCNFDITTGNNVCDIFDFLAFGNLFNTGDPCACNLDISTGNNVCDIFDFLAFGNNFALGAGACR